MEMNFTTETITPEIAKRYLAQNYDGNRNIRKGPLGQIIREIQSGRWVLNGQPILFDTKGTLIDGQHRLTAVIETGIPIKVIVGRNAPPNAFDHIDLGYARSFGDVMKTHGEYVSNTAVAAVRWLVWGDSWEAVTERRGHLEMLELYKQHKSVIDAVTEGGSIPGVTIAPVLGAIALAAYYESAALVFEFRDRLRDGIMQREADRTVILLRESLLRRRHHGSTAVDAYLRTQRAVKAYCNGEILSKLYGTKPIYPALATASPGTLPGARINQLSGPAIR